MENINVASQCTEIEDNPVVPSIRGMLESLPALSSECCIYKVPKRLRELNLKAYRPRVVSIGPFDRGKRQLQVMEEHKLRYLRTFLNRTGRSLEDCVEVVRTWEKRARDCYAKTIELSSDEFVKMILVDGSFIVEFLLRFNFLEFIDESDRIFNKPWMINDMSRDMILLENQLPFFVLEGFFNLVYVSNQEGNPSFLDLTQEYFNPIMKIDKLPYTISNLEIKHFVDFIRYCYLFSYPRVWCQGNARYERPPSVTEVQEAGIKFKIGTNCSLLDIKFTNGILEIPSLVIADRTETLFRNLIAFEQCHCKNDYIIQYMCLLDGMINTSKDVDLLIHHGIIINRLRSSEDVSTLFNNR